jgi:hypothetical protein
MSEARLSISVGTGEESHNPRDQRPRWKKKINFDTAKRLIEAKNYPPEVTAELLKKLAKYPSSTYEKFLSDIGKHLNEVQRQRNN